MRVLFDQGVPLPLGRYLVDCEISSAFQQGWSRLSNGDLLSVAEEASFTVFVTTDQNLRYQQNLTRRQISIIVLPTTQWPEIQRHTAEIQAAINAGHPGNYTKLQWE